MNSACYGLNRRLKQIALYYFRLKRDKSPVELLKSVQKRLSSETYEEVLPVLNNMHRLTNKVTTGKYWPIRRAGIEPLIRHTK